MGKHTPGPWEISDGWDENASTIRIWGSEAKVVGACEPMIADIAWREQASHECDLAEARANARLIAAAPDLLEALTELLDACDGPSVDPDWAYQERADARAAIAKATQ